MPSKRSREKPLLQVGRRSEAHHDSDGSRGLAIRLRHDANESSETQHLPKMPDNWPPNVRYLSFPLASPYLTKRQKQWLLRKPPDMAEYPNGTLPIIKLPQNRIGIDSRINVRIIIDEQHPAYGQRGLFAARDLAPGELVVPYVGYVHSSTAAERAVWDQLVGQRESLQLDEIQAERSLDDSESVSGPHMSSKGRDDYDQDPPPLAIGTWDSSSYDLNLHRDLEENIELAVDAEHMGNEARFCNDYRGVPASVTIDHTSKQWDRKAKRGAKTWAAAEAVIHGDNTGKAGGTPTAIPNAEFGDVWIEWTVGDKMEASGVDATAEDAVASMENLNFGDKELGAKQHCRRRRRKGGMRGVAIFVMPAGKSGKRKHGIQAGQEVLVSYGKGFWSHHGLDLLKGHEAV